MAKPSDTPDPQPTEEEKGTPAHAEPSGEAGPTGGSQGGLAEPERLAAEDSVGAQETPTERQRQREEAVAQEPVAESEQRASEATEPAPAETAGIGPTEDPDAPEPDEEPPAPRVKPEIPGMDLEPDIVLERESVMGEEDEERYAEEGEEPAPDAEADEDEYRAPQPIAATAISLAAGARYSATGRRKTAVARVILKPGTGAYAINGRTLEQHLPRPTLQRQVRNALETVGLEDKMDVVASIQGGGVTAHAGALRHGISRALVDADPNLRAELKRRGFLTRDARAKERKKAGLKKARKRPQFSKR
jgi:small subunit ribosomal protein S9